MKVFISQPMKNKTPEEIKAVRLAAEMMVKVIFPEKKIDIIDSYFEENADSASPLANLGKSLELLATADIAVFCYGWEEARGCRIESAACVAYEIPFIEVTDGYQSALIKEENYD